MRRVAMSMFVAVELYLDRRLLLRSMLLKFGKRQPMNGEGGILHGKKVPARRPFGVSVLPEARETRRFSANVGKKKEASSNAPCAPENQWGGDV